MTHVHYTNKGPVFHEHPYSDGHPQQYAEAHPEAEAMNLREQVEAQRRDGFDGQPWVPLQAVLDLIDAHEDRIASECYGHADAAVNAALDKVAEAALRGKRAYHDETSLSAVMDAIEAARPKP